MGAAVRSSVQTWGHVLALVSSAVVSVGILAQSARAEGVLSGGSFISGGVQPDASMIDALGGSQFEAPAVTIASSPASRKSPRPASPQERTEAATGDDIFRHSRIALPLVLQAAVGEPADAVTTANSVRPMTGPMVGLRPHPRTWGSTLGR